MVRIMAWGDTHQCIEAQEKIVQRNDYNISICCGDIEHFKSMKKPTFFIPGNHDKDKHSEILENIRQGYIKLDNFNYLASGKVELEPFPIAGLGGNYAPTDYDRSRDELKKQRHFTKKEIETCLNLKPRPHIFITHEAPYGVADVVNGDHYGVKPVFRILSSLQPRYFLSGHIHEQQIKQWRDTIAINVGYGYDEEFVIIDTDEKNVEMYKDNELSRTINISENDEEIS